MPDKDLVAASSRPLLLSLLSHGESYGYEIIQQVRSASGGELEWTEGMLYPVLHRLEQEGLIVAEWRTGDTGRKRKYYRLTPGGRKSLKDEKQQWLTVHNTLASLWNIKPASV